MRSKVNYLFLFLIISLSNIVTCFNTSGTGGYDYLEVGEHHLIRSYNEYGQNYTIEWQYDPQSDELTKDYKIEVWIVEKEVYDIWNKIDIEDLDGEMLHSGKYGHGEYNLPRTEFWFVIFYNSLESTEGLNLYMQVNFISKFDSGNSQILLYIIIPIIVILLILSIILIPIAKKSQRFRKMKNEHYDLLEISIKETINQIKTSKPISLKRIKDFSREIYRIKQNQRKIRIIRLRNADIEDIIDELIRKRGISGEYYKVEQIFIKSTNINETSITKTTACFYCGNPFELNVKICDSCGKNIVNCSVCKLPVTFGEKAGKCSLCESIAHFEHLQEWIKVQVKCPSCLQELPLEGIVPILKEEKLKKIE